MARTTLSLALALCVLAVATASAAPSRRFLLQESPAAEANTTVTPVEDTVTAGSEADPNVADALANALQSPSPSPAAGGAGAGGEANESDATAAPAAGLTYATFQEALTAANSTTAGNLTILMAAVEAANLTSAINDTTAWTILAPTNAAFERAFQEINITVEELLAEQPLLVALLSYHVIPSGALNSTALANGTSLATGLPSAGNLTVLRADGNLTLVGEGSNATVVNPDINAGASVIHVIDTVLLPPAEAEVAANNTAGSNMTSPAPADAGAAGANMTSPAPADAGAAANAESPAPDAGAAAANAESPAPANNTAAP